jgi:cytochrome c-type biogenesis protein CcmE
MARRTGKKILIPVLFIIAGLGFLIFRGISDTGVYYMTVGELIKKADSLKGDSVRISGDVVAGTINYNQRDLILSFAIRDTVNPSKTINALYNGPAPDAFKEGVEVVLQGIYDMEVNLFTAKELLAKCPSKYGSEITEEGSN